MTKRQFQWAITIFVGTVIIIGGAGLLLWQAFWPNFEGFGSGNREIPFHEHHNLDPEVPNLIHDMARLPQSDAPQPFIMNEVMYLPVAFFRYHFDPFIFWDDHAGVLFITSVANVLAFYPDRHSFDLNGQPQSLDHPIRRVDGEVFLPADLAEALYPVIVTHYLPYNLIVVESADIPRTTAEVTRRTNIRYREDNRAPITARTESGSTLVLFHEVGEFTRVRNGDGLLGWVATADIGEPTTVIPVDTLERDPLLGEFINNRVHPRPIWPAGTPVVMAWDSIYVQAANSVMMDAYLSESINVLAPMWFRLDAETMGVTSLASREYVEWAQGLGLQVWPYVFDVSVANSSAILTNREARASVIETLLHYVDELGLDGINIGFEHVTQANAPYLMQFLRELGPGLRQRGVVFSKNVLVPTYTRYYRRDLMAYFIDFIVVMAYDEHWHRAPTSGPVASLPFVERGIMEMLEEVPANQVVLGLPFYNRIWREVIGNNTLETRTRRYHGTSYTRATFDNYFPEGTTWEWLPEIGKYYGEYAAHEEGESVLYRVWLECERSMGLKLELFWGYNLAGVSVWNRNFRHNEGLWELMDEHFAGQ
ncbi:MAG: glycosyl hydrolase family 18 protein [Defluviitaleaceae bacterium]|nr:glycosyl hydrolase family 18 protein [Defluviitaleaceae bacterium]